MPVALNLTALTIATIFYAYRDQYVAQIQRTKILRERIAYMLWTTAQQVI